jgi:hypothetical protein
MCKQLKIILEYLKGTLDFGLWYSRGEYFPLVEYTDEYWEDRIDDRKRRRLGRASLFH